MDNYQIAENFSLLSKLMDIHGENSFKAKSYAAAAFNIEKLAEQLSNTPHTEIFSLKGIGESTGKKIIELLDTGEMVALKEIIAKTPAGIIEMLGIKGIGPKKIATIWKEMGIETIGELLYACQENRLKMYKGFGEKTQISIAESIEFYQRNRGHFLYSAVEAIFPQINNYLQKLFGAGNAAVTGKYRRQEYIIEELEYVVVADKTLVKQKMTSANPPELLKETETTLLYKLANGLKLKFYTGTNANDERSFVTSATDEFTEAFRKEFPQISLSTGENDETIFKQAGIQYIPPCQRETAAVIEAAKNKLIPVPIQPEDIKGIIHSHSKWSDGNNTIEEMAKAAAEKGLEYLVISDHSKSAFYANGLSEERIKQQHIEVEQLNSKLAPFKIFKSIECDILNDGSLDYSNSILSTFDLVIASVHSNLKMTEEKAIMRLLNAIENPYTTILGHMTGRLLLSRNGYPVNHEKIITACAAHNVVIELNAHPSRLDIDWRYINMALEKGVLISINPDAHDISGFTDIRYGVLSAQKSFLTKEKNLSSFSLKQIEEYLLKRKSLRKH